MGWPQSPVPGEAQINGGIGDEIPSERRRKRWKKKKMTHKTVFVGRAREDREEKQGFQRGAFSRVGNGVKQVRLQQKKALMSSGQKNDSSLEI